jgi:hypothetical protein
MNYWRLKHPFFHIQVLRHTILLLLRIIVLFHIFSKKSTPKSKNQKQKVERGVAATPGSVPAVHGAIALIQRIRYFKVKLPQLDRDIIIIIIYYGSIS